MTPAAAADVGVVAERRFAAMGTYVHVVALGLDSPQLLDEAEAMVHRCEQRWSRFRNDSELSILNASAGRPVVVSPDTYRLITDAVEARRLTNGIFDPTVLGSLLAAGYDRTFDEITTSGCSTDRPPVVPAPGTDAIEFLPMANAIRLPPGVGLDLGGIAKGATADAVAAMLAEVGAAGCCINVGGDLRAVGTGPDDGAWGIALECPGTDVRAAVRLGDGAVCTSTVLRRRWLAAGRLEHHLRQPLTGAALDSGLVSATVIGARAAQAEVLTKAVLGAGPEGAAHEALRWGVTGIVVDTAGRLIELPGFDAFAATAIDAPSPAAERGVR